MFLINLQEVDDKKLSDIFISSSLDRGCCKQTKLTVDVKTVDVKADCKCQKNKVFLLIYIKKKLDNSNTSSTYLS